MTVEQLYKSFLKQNGISESKMGYVERRQLKRAFYCGVAMILLYNTTEMPKLPTEQAAKKIIQLTNETTEFFKRNE